MIDICIAIMEYDIDLSLLEFLIDIFPEGINEDNIQEYLQSFIFQTKDQIDEFTEKTKILLEISEKNRQSNNIEKGHLNKFR